MCSHVSELTELTRELVRIPSHEDETEAGDRIERWVREETDADVTRDDVGNVIARRNPESDRSLALVGHHDVVPPVESQVVGHVDDPDEYVVEERDGRLHGRGTADMKGALAACMLAFRDAAPDCELVLASFVGEETGGTGARTAVDDGFAPDLALVAEGSTYYSGPGVVDVVVAHKGRRASTLVAHGEATHASVPEMGTNAIYRASDAVDTVRDMTAPAAEVFGEELSGSVVITMIHGGDTWNVVPEECSVTIDERTVPGARAPLERAAELPGVEHVVDQDLPPMLCDDEAFADTALEVAKDIQEGTPQRVTKPHATDAGHLAGAGTSCVVVGAAESGEAHTDSESVSIEVLHTCREIYQELVDRV
jgi:acetylornithine deacetylase